MSNVKNMIAKNRKKKNRQRIFRLLVKSVLKNAIMALPVFGFILLLTVMGLAWILGDDRVFDTLCYISLGLTALYVLFPGSGTVMKIQKRITAAIKRRKNRC